MTTTLRWLFRGLLAVLALAALALAMAYYLAARSLPDYDAQFTLEGLSGEVSIVRDTAGVPHIFAEDDADTFFALGFAHARDRLWQMTLLRRTAQGRLSELFGERTLRIDTLLRRLDLYNLAARAVPAQDADTRAALEAYAAGVNARLTQINSRALGRGAPEFFLFDANIAPWQPADSLAVIKLMGLRLSGQLDTEVLRARTALRIGPERLADILPDSPGDGIAALPELAWLDGAPGEAAATELAGDPLSPFATRRTAGASNAWAAGPSRSTSDSTLLANDPHLQLSAPSIWYLAHLQLSTGDVIGATIPGLPLVLSGRSPDLAWGITSAYVDALDVYLERLDPDDDGRYLTEGGDYAPFRTEPTLIRVNGGGPRTITLRWTERGPVLPPDAFNLGTVTPQGHVTSVAWTLFDPDDTSMSAAMGLMRADSVADGIAAMEGFVGPAQNLILADTDSVAMQVVGALPERREDHQTAGRMPSPGWSPRNQWQGVFPYPVNPRFTDPDGGIVGNTNNKMIDRPFPRHVSFDWGDTQRIHRWRRLMQDRAVHSRDSFIEAQLDTVSPAARTLLPLIGRELFYTDGTRADAAPLRRQALEILADWNGEMNEHLAAPLIYASWVRALQQRLITDELGGALASAFIRVEPLFLERVYRDIDGASVWCDVVHSEAVETCEQMARLALDDALTGIEAAYGSDLAALRWGQVHVAHHDHEALGGLPVISWLVNIRQSTSGGDFTLRRGQTSGSPPTPFASTHGAGYRGVYDMADPANSVFILGTGQSGHPLSDFYGNMADRWRRGGYVPMSLDRDLSEAGSVGTTTLSPR